MPYDSKGRCIVMTPEARAREQIDNRLRQSGWTIQDLKQLNLTVASGVAVREFPTNTGPVDYALFIEGVPVGVVEAKKDEEGQALTDVETQSSRYANSQFKWVKRGAQGSVCLRSHWRIGAFYRLRRS